jgi:ketosteroid isomerase-like protein
MTTNIDAFLTAWTTAERTRDLAFLAANLTDDFVGVGPLGFALPKQAWLARHRGDDLKYETFDLDEVIVREHGDVTMVTARQTAIGTFKERPVPSQLRDTLVIVTENGAPKIASLHMSFIAGTPGAPELPGAAR